MYRDSVGKIKGYLDAVLINKEVVVSKMFFRDYSCPAKCGACCLNFTLDYFEGERWELFKKTYPKLVKRFVKREVDGVTVYTDFQEDNKGHYCINLDQTNGRCKIHTANPFSCEFELMKMMVKEDKTFVINKLYGRGWNMLRIDGKRGALCEMLPFNKTKFHRDIELLEELNQIGIKFKIKTKLSKVISYLKSLGL